MQGLKELDQKLILDLQNLNDENANEIRKRDQKYVHK